MIRLESDGTNLVVLDRFAKLPDVQLERVVRSVASHLLRYRSGIIHHVLYGSTSWNAYTNPFLWRTAIWERHGGLKIDQIYTWSGRCNCIQKRFRLPLNKEVVTNGVLPITNSLD